MKIQITQKHFFRSDTCCIRITLKHQAWTYFSFLHYTPNKEPHYEKYSSGPEGRSGLGQHLWLTFQLKTWLNLPINPVGLSTCPTTNMSGLSVCTRGDSSLHKHVYLRWRVTCVCLILCVCANVFVLDSKCKCLLAKMCIVYVISALQWQWEAIKHLKQHKTRIKSAGLCLYWCFLSQVETCPLMTRDMVVCSQWHWLCVMIEACHCCFLPLQCAHRIWSW